MKLAIIGSGISGLAAAHWLHKQHEITVFEANGYVGGHTNTVDVSIDSEQHAVDTGFIVFNNRTYPNFCRLMDELNVASDATQMSFSVRCDRTGLEYNGTSFDGVFAQRRNMLRPQFLRMIRDILRFNRDAVRLVNEATEELTVWEFLRQHRFGRGFAEHYLLPMGAAIWSCPPQTFEQFPIRFIVSFYHNHGLLSLKDRPTWRVIRGGSQRYVEALAKAFQSRIRLNCAVQSVRRGVDDVTVTTQESGAETFDEVIFACHSDQALRILGCDARATERAVLSAIPYQSNTAVLHTDTLLLPRNRRAWACWNYHLAADNKQQATLTYNMNMLQHIDSQHTFCVTLNEDDLIDEGKVLGRFRYSHPIFTTERAAAQRRHRELIRSNGTSFCGAYWGNGFHEDGVLSALSVTQAFQNVSASEAEVLAHA